MRHHVNQGRGGRGGRKESWGRQLGFICPRPALGRRGGMLKDGGIHLYLF